MSPSCVFVRGTWSKCLCAGIWEQSMKARHREGIGLSYRPWDGEKPNHVVFKYLSRSLMQKRGEGEGRCNAQRDQRGVAPTQCWNWGKWGLEEYIWNGVLSWLVRWALVPVQEFFRPAMAALVGLVHFFASFVPIAQQARQSCCVAYLLIRVLWGHFKHCMTLLQRRYIKSDCFRLHCHIFAYLDDHNKFFGVGAVIIYKLTLFSYLILSEGFQITFPWSYLQQNLFAFLQLYFSLVTTNENLLPEIPYGKVGTGNILVRLGKRGPCLRMASYFFYRFSAWLEEYFMPSVIIYICIVYQILTSSTKVCCLFRWFNPCHLWRLEGGLRLLVQVP